MKTNEKELDIFECMGIETKEDRFTDFIKTLFENDKEFKIKLLDMLVEKSEQKLNKIEDYDDYTITIRQSFKSKDGKKIVPDIIISERETAVALIEVKLFSDEGYEQIKRYNDYFKDKENNQVAIFFLSFDKNSKLSDKAILLSWQEDFLKILEVNNHSNNTTAIGYLKTSLIARLKKYSDEIKKIDEGEKDLNLKYFFEDNGFFISRNKINYLINNIIKINEDYRTDSFVLSSQQGTYVTDITKKDGWKTELQGDQCLIDNNYNFFVRIEWRNNDENIKAYIHWETCPYITKNKLSDGYKSAKEKFINEQISEIIETQSGIVETKKWEIKTSNKYQLKIAQAVLCNVEDSIETLNGNLDELLSAADKIITEIISELNVH